MPIEIFHGLIFAALTIRLSELLLSTYLAVQVEAGGVVSHLSIHDRPLLLSTGLVNQADLPIAILQLLALVIRDAHLPITCIADSPLLQITGPAAHAN